MAGEGSPYHSLNCFGRKERMNGNCNNRRTTGSAGSDVKSVFIQVINALALFAQLLRSGAGTSGGLACEIALEKVLHVDAAVSTF